MRILILGPWAIGRPRHGGQLRATNIAAAYRAAGHDVMFMGVFDPGNVSVEDTTSDDVAIDHLAMNYIAASRKSWEFSLWDAFAEVPELFERFRTAVERFQPHVVQFEEPYLWPVVRQLRTCGCLDGILIVHSSYNFETEYRRDLADVLRNQDLELLRKVARQEEEIARCSDLVAAVSDADASCFQRIGARRVIVIRNGARKPVEDLAASRALNAYFGRRPFALFVSSAHPPNARGLLDLAPGLKAPLPGLMAICGGVGTLLEAHRVSWPLIRNARILGIVDPLVLDALLLHAAVILLPKTRGGGSNLKTSEALLSGRPIVGTEQAFVGFEPWRGVPGVTVEDDPALFWQHVEKHLMAGPECASIERSCDELLWPACVAPLVAAVEDLVQDARHRQMRVH
jgi:hypothetical protein